MNWLIFDFETTGFIYKKCFILSIGAICWNDETDERSEFYELLDWTQVEGINFEIPEDSAKVHGITIEMLKTDPHSHHPAKVITHMFDWISEFMDGKENRNINGLCAFNSSFDVNMGRSNLQWMVNHYVSDETPAGGYHTDEVDLSTHELDKMNHILKVFTKRPSILFIDSMTMDRIFHYEEDGVKVKHNLEDVGLRYGLDVNAQAHNAMYDTRRLADVFKMQVQELKEKNLEMNAAFETRLVNKWNRDQARFGSDRKKSNACDYYGLEMGPLEV